MGELLVSGFMSCGMGWDGIGCLGGTPGTVACRYSHGVRESPAES